MDLRSDGLHPSNFSQVRPQKNVQSNRQHSENVIHVVEDAQNDFPRLSTMRSDRVNHCREHSLDSNQSDDDGYDMVTGANFTPQMVPEFLTDGPCNPKTKLLINVSMMTR